MYVGSYSNTFVVFSFHSYIQNHYIRSERRTDQVFRFVDWVDPIFEYTAIMIFKNESTL